MRITKAEFIQGGLDASAWPDESVPEIAFIGRSNVGKSSLINHLVNRKHLARTSATPGKTQMINFYNINNLFYLVDLPGYGFTRVPESVNRTWRSAIDHYLKNRTSLKVLCHLIDIRHPGLKLDIQVSQWLRLIGIPVITVHTKSDKLSTAKAVQNINSSMAHLGLSETDPMISYSILSPDARDKMWRVINKNLD